MEICSVPSLFLFYLIILLIPFAFSTLHLSHRRHPHLSNASDHEALLGFMSAITPSPLSTTWKPNVSFCNWTGITCSRRRPRVVSLNVSGMDLQEAWKWRYYKICSLVKSITELIEWGSCMYNFTTTLCWSNKCTLYFSFEYNVVRFRYGMM